MAKQSLQRVYADFRQGMIDTASPLQQPEGTVKDIVNFDIDIDGTLIKRAGLSPIGEGHQIMLSSAIGNSDGVQMFLWENVANDVNRTFVVLRTGVVLHVYPADEGKVSFSSDKKIAQIALSSSGKPWPTLVTGNASFANASGRLFYAHRNSGPGYLEYVPESNIVTNNTLDIRFRDTELWEGPTDVDTGIQNSSASVITAWRDYNLRNAGWVTSAELANSAADTRTRGRGNPIRFFRQILGRWPRLSEPYEYGRMGMGDSVRKQTAFSPWHYESNYIGISQGIVGKFVHSVDSFQRSGRLRTASSDGATHTETYNLSEGLSKIAFYAGRLWYAGEGTYSSSVNTILTTSPLDNTGIIYYSQSLNKNISNASKCYQANDPSDPDINEVLATDGGTISIKEMGIVRSLLAVGTSLLVVSDKGVWSISGSDGNSFNAESFSVNKISDKGVGSPKAVTQIRDVTYLFTQDGLFSVQASGPLGELVYEDLSTAKISKFFDQLPAKSAASAIVSADKDKGIITAYLSIPDAEEDVDSDFFKKFYNTVLIYNTNLEAFYKYEIELPENYFILDVLYGLDTEVISFTEDVVDSNGEAYTDSNGDVYFIPTSFSFRAVDNRANLLVYNGEGLLPFGYVDNQSFEDFDKGFEAKAVTGFDSLGNLISDNKQAPLVVAYLQRTPVTLEAIAEGEVGKVVEDSCKMSYFWDWKTKVLKETELYRENRFYVPEDVNDTYDYQQDILSTKNRVRGRGTALSVTLRSEENKACHIVGLGVQFIGEA